MHSVCWMRSVRVRRWSLAWICGLFLVVPIAHGHQKKRDKTSVPNLPSFQSSEETNDRITELALAEKAKQGDYLIGSGDLLGIEVFGIPELTRDVRVNELGDLMLPLISTPLRASGLTAFQLQDKIAEELKSRELVTDPQVTVAVKERHSAPITVTGAVKNPQVIQAVRQMSLIEVLSAVGGLAPDAGNKVIITRPTTANQGESAASSGVAPITTITVNVDDLLESGDMKDNVPVLGGDVLLVPRGGIVYAVGALSHPAGYVLQNDHEQMTALKLMLLAGGLIPSAKAHDAVILRPDPATGQRQQVPIDLAKISTFKTKDVPLYQSDILYVPDSQGKRALHKTGQVAVELASGAALIGIGRVP